MSSVPDRLRALLPKAAVETLARRLDMRSRVLRYILDADVVPLDPVLRTKIELRLPDLERAFGVTGARPAAAEHPLQFRVGSPIASDEEAARFNAERQDGLVGAAK